MVLAGVDLVVGPLLTKVAIDRYLVPSGRPTSILINRFLATNAWGFPLVWAHLVPIPSPVGKNERGRLLPWGDPPRRRGRSTRTGRIYFAARQDEGRA